MSTASAPAPAGFKEARETVAATAERAEVFLIAYLVASGKIPENQAHMDLSTILPPGVGRTLTNLGNVAKEARAADSVEAWQSGMEGRDGIARTEALIAARNVVQEIAQRDTSLADGTPDDAVGSMTKSGVAKLRAAMNQAMGAMDEFGVLNLPKPQAASKAAKAAPAVESAEARQWRTMLTSILGRPEGKERPASATPLTDRTAPGQNSAPGEGTGTGSLAGAL